MIKFTLTFMGLVLCTSLSAQSFIQYGYDGAGNRIKREQIIIGGGAQKTGNTSSREDVITGTSEAIQEKIADVDVTIFPNPLKEKINLKITGELNNGYQVTIVDYSGKQVHNKTYQDPSKQINLSHLSKGNYIMRVLIEDNFFELKLIKQ